MPFLERIDQTRWYTNLGPLAKELEAHLTGAFGLTPDEGLLIANGTEALTLTLLAFERPETKYCVMPSWTFAATPLAAIHAGLVPVFADIELETWAISPKTVRATLQELKVKTEDVHSVIPVSPFGGPVELKAWEEFAKADNIPVLVDAAASFDSVASKAQFKPGLVPTMISLHATKVFGVGEGALILSKDKALIEKLRKYINFGFWGSRETQLLGKNAKLSEYACAVGLAEFANWPTKRESWVTATKNYLNRAGRLKDVGVEFIPGYGQGWISSYCNILTRSREDRVRVEKTLANAYIETRAWWGQGAHQQKVFAEFPCGRMTATEDLAQRTIALPFFTDLSESEVERITTAVVGALSK